MTSFCPYVFRFRCVALKCNFFCHCNFTMSLYIFLVFSFFVCFEGVQVKRAFFLFPRPVPWCWQNLKNIDYAAGIKFCLFSCSFSYTHSIAWAYTPFGTFFFYVFLFKVVKASIDRCCCVLCSAEIFSCRARPIFLQDIKVACHLLSFRFFLSLGRAF